MLQFTPAQGGKFLAPLALFIGLSVGSFSLTKAAYATQAAPAAQSEPATAILSAQQGSAAIAQAVDREDMLAKNPGYVMLWAGTPYAIEYHSPRGHHFALSDVSQSLRTAQGEGYGSCWSCKSPQVAPTMQQMGQDGFAAHSFAQLAPKMLNTIACQDCHPSDTSGELALPRPYSQAAMNKIKKPFASQDNAMQQAQVCGQCHVTYYMQPEKRDQVNIPWIFGNSAQLIEKYYDTRQFYEWLHPVSKTPLVKARHPEFEHWASSAHADAGISCVTCHMGESTNADGDTHTNHFIQDKGVGFQAVCAECHESGAEIEALIADNKAKIHHEAKALETALIQAHYEAGAAWQAGATWPQMNGALMAIRHSQWRWDFVISSHGTHAHNASEGLALLKEGQMYIQMARAQLKKINAELKVTEIHYPQYRTKAEAQAEMGIELSKLQQEKHQFIEQVILKSWSKEMHLPQ